MVSVELTTHSFVVKIWIEEPATERKAAEWRGHITHVVSGKKQYIQSLDDVTSFIRPYLESLGVTF